MASIVTRVKSSTFALLGGICCFSYICFLLLSIPMHIFRLFLILLVRWLRPDLSEIISGQSVAFLSDYFSETPRSNIVATSLFQGQFTHEEFKSIVLEKWLNARHDPDKRELIYKKLQQYPVKWMGFGFWRNSTETVSIDNHVLKLFGNDVEVTNEQVENTCEKLLNSPFPRNQSPWEIYIIENFKAPDSQTSTLAILRFHHILGDGYSIMSAILTELFNANSISISVPNIQKTVQKSVVKRIWSNFTLPVRAMFELSYFMSFTFRPSLWKVPDRKKEWHQIFVKTDPIPISTIKRIKNSVGVTFTSVILSVISAALMRLDEDIRNRNCKNNKSDEDYLLCACTLPVVDGHKNKRLTNSFSAALLDLPIKKFESPCERLKELHEILERTKTSIVPYVTRFYTSIIGLHWYPLAELLSKNKTVPIIITNIPGIQSEMELNGRRWLDGDFIMGGFNGDAGMVITVLSINQQIRIGVIVEKGLLSMEEAKQMTIYITDEIQLLCDFIEC